MKAEEFRRHLADFVNDEEPPQQVVIGHMDLAGHLEVDTLFSGKGIDERTGTPFNEIVIGAKIPDDLVGVAGDINSTIDRAIRVIKTNENAHTASAFEDVIADLRGLNDTVMLLAILASIKEE